MKVPSWMILIAVAAVVVAAGVGVGIGSSRTAARWNADKATWQRDVAARQTQRVGDSVLIARLTDNLDTTRTQLVSALRRSRTLSDEASRLRRERAEVVVTPSVPGLPPSVGDTLRACRATVALCVQEAAAERIRADSLEATATEAVFQLGSAQGDVATWKQSAALDRALLRRAEGLIAAAEAPCILFRVGPARVNCPDRRTVGLMAAGATLAAIGQTREQRLMGLAVIAIGIVW